jgi:hypothetical protein
MSKATVLSMATGKRRFIMEIRVTAPGIPMRCVRQSGGKRGPGRGASMQPACCRVEMQGSVGGLEGLRDRRRADFQILDDETAIPLCAVWWTA